MTAVILSEEETEKLKSLAKALKPFREIRDTMPLQFVELILAVAIKPDSTVNELSSATGIAPSLVSRQLGDIGEVNRYHQPGHDLVATRSNIMDRRFNLTRLTPRGRALAGQVLKAMGR
jgi:DNA-binding MarR family transcriptional regulator